MKLKKGFITHVTNGEQIMIGMGKADFSGFVRSNETAAFIVDQLKKETTREAILRAMEAEYDGPREAFERDIDKVLGVLRKIGAVEGE